MPTQSRVPQFDPDSGRQDRSMSTGFNVFAANLPAIGWASALRGFFAVHVFYYGFHGRENGKGPGKLCVNTDGWRLAARQVVIFISDAANVDFVHLAFDSAGELHIDVCQI
jgi:hypothetical protein